MLPMQALGSLWLCLPSVCSQQHLRAQSEGGLVLHTSIPDWKMESWLKADSAIFITDVQWLWPSSLLFCPLLLTRTSGCGAHLGFPLLNVFGTLLVRSLKEPFGLGARPFVSVLCSSPWKRGQEFCVLHIIISHRYLFFSKRQKFVPNLKTIRKAMNKRDAFQCTESLGQYSI